MYVFALIRSFYLQARERAKETSLLALRFEEDKICPVARFETLNKELGDNAHFQIISATQRKRDGIRSSPHAIFTEDFADAQGQPYPCTQEAFEQLIKFFQTRLTLTK